MNIVFLDIDGVLQPYESEFRFYTDKKLIGDLSKKYNIDYSAYNFWDVAGTFYDWDEQAISRVKYILDSTHSKIIMSSNWRNEKQPNKMKDLLTIQGLNKYYFADNEIISKDVEENKIKRRALEIERSIIKYNIDNFAILDDFKGLEEYYPNNAVITHNIISINDMNKCIKILKRK